MSVLLPYETTLLDGLFAGRHRVKISELKGTFHPRLRAAENQVYSDAMARKLFRIRPDLMRAGALGLAVLIVAAGAALSYLLGVNFGWGLTGAAVGLVGVALIATSHLISTRTAAGRDLMQHTLGFRLYMTTAEKYRQQFAEKAEIFTQLLPYAIVFGCVGGWAKAFQGIDTSRANGWYSGNQPFQAVLLASRPRVDEWQSLQRHHFLAFELGQLQRLRWRRVRRWRWWRRRRQLVGPNLGRRPLHQSVATPRRGRRTRTSATARSRARFVRRQMRPQIEVPRNQAE